MAAHAGRGAGAHPAGAVDRRQHARRRVFRHQCLRRLRSPHAGPSAGLAKESAGRAARHGLERLLLYHVMPRISPDGAEAYLGRHQLVRSAPRDMAVPPTLTLRWVYQDLDGDGVLRYMRHAHPAGNYVEHPDKRA